MFRIVCDPSSGSTELCLNEITLSGSQIFFACLVGVWQRNFERAVCVYGTTGCSPSYRAHTHRRFKITLPNTDQAQKNICEPLRVISVKHSSVLPDDGSHKIRNILE